MGMWYGSEILVHDDNEGHESYYRTCVVIHLADITSQVSTSLNSQEFISNWLYFYLYLKIRF